MRHIHHTLPCTAAATPSGVQLTTAHTSKQLAPQRAFALRAGRAMTLQPRAAATLRITQGAAWVTLASQPGDHFLQAGDALPISACDRVVMEAWHVPAHESLYFDWDSTPLPVAAPDGMAVRGSWRQPASGARTQGAAPLGLLAPSYCDAVLAPLADLRGAAVLGGKAAVRLVLGLAALTLGKVLDTAIFLATSRARASTA